MIFFFFILYPLSFEKSSPRVAKKEGGGVEVGERRFCCLSWKRKVLKVLNDAQEWPILLRKGMDFGKPFIRASFTLKNTKQQKEERAALILNRILEWKTH